MWKKTLPVLVLISLLTIVSAMPFSITPVQAELPPTTDPSQEAPLAEWNYTYGGYDDEYAFSVEEASDGGYVMAGATHSYGIGIDAWLVKTNSTGSVQWQRNYGGGSQDYAISVQKTSDGGYIMAGSTKSFSSDQYYDSWLIKTDAAGAAQWTRAIGIPGADQANFAQQTSDGGYIVAGSYYVHANTFWLIKTNAAGIMEWNTQWGGNGSDIAYSAQQTKDGGYIAAGSTTSYNSVDGLVIKTNSNGKIEWNKTYGGSDSLEMIATIQQTSDLDYIAAGHTNSSGSGKADFWLIKISSSGSATWSRTFGGLDDDWGSSVQQTSDGGYVIAGSTYSSGDSSPDYLVVKTDSNGNEEWRKVIGTPDTDQGQSIHETKDGGYVVAGYSYYSGGGVSTDGWLAKIVGDTDKDGLPDTWERKGIDYNKDGVVDLNLADLGADWKHKDLFVEVDYMGSNGTHNHKPDTEAINDVKTAFRNAPVKNPDNTEGITLHVDIDEEIPHQDVIKMFDEYDTIKTAHFGSETQRSDPNSVNILEAKKLVYHYCLFVHQYSTNETGNWISTTSSGLAECAGNDFIVSLGGWTGGFGSRDEQAGTFMHEFGHNLNLGHGGGDDVSYKPNYLSIMNYAFQFPDLNPNRPLDYSRTKLPDLDEGHLNENKGIGAEVTGQMLMTVFSNRWGNSSILSAGFTPIDWNQNGNATEPDVSANINNFRDWGAGSPGDEILTGYDDWQNLVYNFRDLDNYADNAHGLLPTDDLTWEIVQQMREAAELIHDVAILKVDTPTPMIATGSSLNLSVTVMNQGSSSETLHVTVYANSTSVTSTELTLNSWNIVTVNLTGATSGFSEGDYMLSAYLTPVANENDVGDNTYSYGLLEIASEWVDWSQFYSETDGKAYSVCQTTDGGFAIAGKGGYYEEFCMVKTYPNGSDQWTKTYGFGDLSREGAHSVRQTKGGGYILAGYTTYPTGFAALWLVKTDPEGNMMWSKTYGGDDHNDMYEPQWVALQTSDEGYIAVGSRRSYPTYTYDMWLIKTDSQGNELWNKTYGGLGVEYAYSVWQTTDGGYVIGGYTSGGGSEGDGSLSGAWLLKTDSAGNEQWNKTYANARSYSVQQTADGGYILAGAMYYYGENPGSDFWLLKTDSGGNIQWDRTYDSTLWSGMAGDSIEEAYCVQQTADGGYILAGKAQAYGADNVKAWIVKTDASGNMKNDLAYGENADLGYVAYSVQETRDGGYVAAGYTEQIVNPYPPYTHDFLLLKFSLVKSGPGPADITPPTTTNDYNGMWHTLDFAITLTATDDTEVNATYYRLNGGSQKSIAANGQPQITTEGSANTLEYWSVDTAGNEELPHKTLTQIKLDKTIPTGGIQIDNGAVYTNSTTVSLKLAAADAVSGVSQMRFNNDYGAWSSWEPYSTSKSWSLTPSDGTKNVFVQYRDYAGLTVTAYQIITLDTVAPVANAGQNQTVLTGTSVTFNGTGSTDNSAVVSYLWDFGDGTTGTGITPSHTYANLGTYTVRLMVRDAAGNSAASSATVTIEVVIPEFSSALVFMAILILLSALAVLFRRKRVIQTANLN